ncbi:PEP-CTERM sorting domain-containing protein [Arenibaculum pallidiluteum]|uniref:PEP-CTERM sorting domain-containing protein n=1 Tax=Arenibaculum pallidiluteum TaxID=2812559 RepID=UPI001F2F6733|nr:PEP-CTERM sorting domain-containing protein [Arenibaculum pallidiluteum]
MKTPARALLAATLAAASLAAADQADAATLYANRSLFGAAIGMSVTDDYSNPEYLRGDIIDGPDYDYHSDARMSAIFGETTYRTTFFPDNNAITNQPGNPAYCAACNGSFALSFGTTSLAEGGGVYGVAFDMIYLIFSPTATVSFASGATMDFRLSGSFWGITSDDPITGVHIGGPGGQVRNDFLVVMDNLTIAAAPVPEPATIALLGFGLAGLAAAARRRDPA